MRYGAAPRLKRDLITLGVVSAAYLAASALVTNSYYQLIMTLVPIWATFGVSWNILSGYGGQLSFGHASFFGIGAYVVTLALVYWNLTPWLGIPLGMVVAAGRRHPHRAAHLPPARPLLRPLHARLPAGDPLLPAIPRLPGNVAADASGKPGSLPGVHQPALLHPGRRRPARSPASRLHAGGELPLRPRAARHPAERARRRGRRHQRAAAGRCAPWSSPA